MNIELLEQLGIEIDKDQILEQLIEKAAGKLASQAVPTASEERAGDSYIFDSENRYTRIRERASEICDERLNKEISTFFESKFTPTNFLGEKVGEPILFQDLIEERVQSFWSEDVDRSGQVAKRGGFSSCLPRYQYVAKEFIDKTVKKEMEKMSEQLASQAMTFMQDGIKAIIDSSFESAMKNLMRKKSR